MDFNNDGIITRADFRHMAAVMGLGEFGAYLADQAFNRLDRDGNGILTPNELAAANGSHLAVATPVLATPVLATPALATPVLATPVLVRPVLTPRVY